MRNLWYFVYFIIFGSFCCISCGTEKVCKQLEVIPVPEKVKFGDGTCRLNRYTSLYMPDLAESCLWTDELDSLTNSLAAYCFTRKQGDARENYIRFSLDSLCGAASEGYLMEIRPQGIEVKAATSAGLFYGLQTLLQILNDRHFYKEAQQCWLLPVLQIADKPAFPYRGLHLDVSRHFFPVAFVKKYIDLMAMYKLNRFHWHLTDAGGWRFEVKAYPELTRRGAWRTQEDWREWWNGGDRAYLEEGEKGAYGGYYTQDEVRDIVAYAAARHIEVIPEIEMPGHSEEVLAVYPQLSCSGRGKSGEFCAGNEASFRFIENVLKEVMELFPSEYIHIGGDEASKSAWKKCSLCQKRIRTEHLKDEKELQSYFIKRVEKFLTARGRKIIGWDEILEGGLAPEATVMSWRGEKGGIESARSGHDVIMTPGGYCYFDSYQAEPSTQPYAIGGFLPYLKVYSYHPVPSELSEEESRHILGAQANIWTEYICTPEHVEYMAYPRVLALSEVVWSPEEKKNNEDFKRRVQSHICRLQARGVNVFRLSDRIEMEMEVDTLKKQIRVSFDSEKYNPEIRYTLDGSLPNAQSAVYNGPFRIDSAEVKAALFHEGVRSKAISSGRFDYHKAIGKKVRYTNKYSGSYPAAGDVTLIDGYRGGLTYGDGRWQGFLRNLDVVIDLETVQPLHSVGIKFMQLTGPGVYMPQYVTVSVSEDGANYTEVGQVKNDIPSDKPDLFFKDFITEFSASARYVRIFAKKQAGFMFTDEIVVY
ncbi:MAG: family 20 glycosylhydrolase [Odoribacter sp.]|nr:family 20 glycosylhydrolase [Odoribacter sp.]